MKNLEQYLLIDFITILLGLVLAFIVLFPIPEVGEFQYYTMNIILVVLLCLIIRYIFFMGYSVLAYAKYVKIGMIVCTIPFIFMLVGQFHDFHSYVDEESRLTLLSHTTFPEDYSERSSISNYIYKELSFFFIASSISCGVLALRLIVSLWRNTNTGKA